MLCFTVNLSDFIKLGDAINFNFHFTDWTFQLGISKKISAASRSRDCADLGPWNHSISNHLYWTASNASSKEEAVAMWTSVVNHVQDVHHHNSDVFPSCLHGDLSGDDRDKAWLPDGKYFSHISFSSHLICQEICFIYTWILIRFFQQILNL